MSDVEYRAYIYVPALDIESDDAERLLVELEALHGNLGPVLSGQGKGLSVILGTDRGDRAEAAGEMFEAVVDGLRGAGLAGLYPTTVEVESADALAAA